MNKIYDFIRTPGRKIYISVVPNPTPEFINWVKVNTSGALVSTMRGDSLVVLVDKKHRDLLMAYKLIEPPPGKFNIRGANVRNPC